MNVIDIALVVLLAASVAVSFNRGFGRAVFDFAAIFIALRIASLAAPAVAHIIRPARDAPGNEAFCLAALFVVLAAAFVYAGKLAHDRTQFSLEMFDSVLGAVLGLAIGVIVGHLLVTTLVVAAGGHTQAPEVLQQSGLGMEFYQFDAYHNAMHFMYSLGS